MREYVNNLDVLANLVSMLRADTDGAIWLADGDEDARFYQGCAHQSAKVIPAPNLSLRLLETVQARGIQGVVACVDGIKHGEYLRDNIFHPDLGDVACILLAAKTCERVVHDICGIPWLTACEKQVGSIQLRVAWIARLLTQLREMCEQDGVRPLNLDRIPEIVHWETFELAWEQVSIMLRDRGLKHGVPQEIRHLECGSDVKAHLLHCDGTVAVRVMAEATHLYRPRGIKPYRQVDAKELIGMLRVSFDLSELERYDMYWRMRNWERRNATYPLLRKWRHLDPLGMVWDQRYWESDLSLMLQSLPPSSPFCAFKMDLDNFKSVNEALGHSAGDEAIRLYCLIVTRLLGKVGEVYRRGGDEIVVLAPELEDATAQVLAEKVRAAVASDFVDWGARRGLSSPPTASIGLVITRGGQRIDEIIRLMDKAQQQAKQQGKNRVVVL